MWRNSNWCAVASLHHVTCLTQHITVIFQAIIITFWRYIYIYIMNFWQSKYHLCTCFCSKHVVNWYSSSYGTFKWTLNFHPCIQYARPLKKLKRDDSTFTNAYVVEALSKSIAYSFLWHLRAYYEKMKWLLNHKGLLDSQFRINGRIECYDYFFCNK